MRKKYIIGSMVLVATAAAVVTISANGISGNTASDITGSSEIAYETTIEESEAKLAISEKNTVGAGKSSEESEEDALKEYLVLCGYEQEKELELILSCSSSPVSDFLPGCQALFQVWQSTQ